MDAQTKSDAALWMERMGYHGKQMSQAAETLGMSGRTFMRKRDGEVELTLTDRLAMAALRAGLSPWSPETDQELANFADLAKLVERIRSGTAQE